MVEEPHLRCIAGASSVYVLLGMLSKTGGTFSEMVRHHATGELLEYDPIYRGESDWKLLPPIDVLSTWGYFQGFTANHVGYGSAILVVLLAITFVLAYVQVTRFRMSDD